MTTDTVADGSSTVPAIVGVVSVMLDPSTGEVIATAGAVVSTVNPTASGSERLPASSSCVATAVASPSASSSVTGTLHVPSPVTTVV
jgi:hypothetical protein